MNTSRLCCRLAMILNEWKVNWALISRLDIWFIAKFVLGFLFCVLWSNAEKCYANLGFCLTNWAFLELELTKNKLNLVHGLWT